MKLKTLVKLLLKGQKQGYLNPPPTQFSVFKHNAWFKTFRKIVQHFFSPLSAIIGH